MILLLVRQRKLGSDDRERGKGEKRGTVMVADGGVATVGERAGASVAYARDIVWVSTEIPSDNSTNTQRA